MAIKPGSLCYLRSPNPKVNGRVVTAIKYVHAWLNGHGVVWYWSLDAPWAGKPPNKIGWGCLARCLVPIDDPDGADGCRYREPLAPMVPA